jgi:hypothetical protein
MTFSAKPCGFTLPLVARMLDMGSQKKWPPDGCDPVFHIIGQLTHGFLRDGPASLRAREASAR